MDNPHTIKAYDDQATELYYKENRTPEEEQRLIWLTTEDDHTNATIGLRIILSIIILAGVTIGFIWR